ncbi:hypothetical protein EJ04DRAFT_411741, partial [Polyplosphaeria fusca]
MSRHRQKDEEAGAEGCGILNTRKRMWKDPQGNIVTKKPHLHEAQRQSSQGDPLDQAIQDFIPFAENSALPISPPISHDPSLGRRTLTDRDSGIASTYPSTLDPHSLSSSGGCSPPIDQNFWPGSDEPQPETFLTANAFDDAPFDDIFNPDTASSFNNPFTTMNNYNWLFDMDLSRPETMQAAGIMADPLPTFQFDPNPVTQMSHHMDLQFDHMTATVDKLSTGAQDGSNPSQQMDSPQHVPTSTLISPPLTDKAFQSNHKSQPSNHSLESNSATSWRQQLASPYTPPDIERPLSMLQPSRSLPIIDELARAQILDLIDITQPVAPDGSLVTRDHPLLSLSCLQTYCDLYFTRFNTAYPLIHMSTFEPSHVDTLLLISVLLLGATYGEKDAHQLAVCIHDVLRPQIFANAGFSAKPDLWVLQTILLVECFGKSRAGQKQHDMSHLFHGLLINLIRRSDCQIIRPPTPDDATDDLEDDWHNWVEAEQKKRLAFLCFMWDTQHAVLFCQSLCMSAFELRSDLPCDQALWEADSAETWHQLRQKHNSPPLFLSHLKMYLNPTTAASSPPKSLNALSRSLLLHGLMSIAWDMQRRDQTSLSLLSTPHPLTHWRSRLSTSYNAWHADFSTFCTHHLSQLPPSHPLAHEFSTFRTATLALFHAAHILLHTPFLDLQIYAGARHILGRTVARQDYIRSQKIVKKWVAEHSSEANTSVWHAAALVSSGTDILDSESSELGAGRLWHLPWAVYLGTLVVWGVWYAKPVAVVEVGREEEEDEIVWDAQAEMRGLLGVILANKEERALE